MRIVTTLFLALAGSAGAQEVVYRNVAIPKADASAAGIEFMLPLADSLAAQRIREAADERKLELNREERGVTYLGKTLPGVCDATRVPFVAPGSRPPTGPCVVSVRIEYRAGDGGTIFTISGNGMMQMPGSDAFYGEWFHPRSKQWSMIRNLAKAIAER